MSPWRRGHTVALLMAASSLGIRRVTETEDALVVEYGEPSPQIGRPLDKYTPTAKPSKGPQSRRKYPVRR